MATHARRIPESILDEPIAEAVKERLPKPLHPGKYRLFPPPRKNKSAKRKAIEEDFDPIPRQKSLRTVKVYEDEILDLFVETGKLVFSQNPSDPIPRQKSLRTVETGKQLKRLILSFAKLVFSHNPWPLAIT